MCKVGQVFWALVAVGSPRAVGATEGVVAVGVRKLGDLISSGVSVDSGAEVIDGKAVLTGAHAESTKRIHTVQIALFLRITEASRINGFSLDCIVFRRKDSFVDPLTRPERSVVDHRILEGRRIYRRPDCLLNLALGRAPCHRLCHC